MGSEGETTGVPMKPLDAFRNRPRRVSVRDAWLEHERYSGRRLVTGGVVRLFAAGTPGAYFVLDDGPHRIGLRGDAARLRAYLGRPVEAIGVLTFKPGVGIFLDVEELRPRRRED